MILCQSVLSYCLNFSVDIKVNPPAEADESDPSDIYEQSYISDEDTSSLAGYVEAFLMYSGNCVICTPVLLHLF